ncbi:uncharacterized protein LOC125210101 [Salvia hispanica]|uniref:uncharacterized protein LOC125210101 n=1 Tax=Salvia hispanica TaxID=49212 RepID=UPI002009D36C|nr:uncharacterized protein LOC125210101 [Salvia hispanica]
MKRIVFVLYHLAIAYWMINEYGDMIRKEYIRSRQRITWQVHFLGKVKNIKPPQVDWKLAGKDCGFQKLHQEFDFLWRTCVNSLPIKENLYRRGIDAGSVCEICGLNCESSDHLLLHCTEVVNIWRYGPLRLDSHLLNSSSFKQVVWSLLEKLPHEAFALFACTAWNMWKRRNEFYFDQKVFNWEEILLLAHKNWMEMLDTFEKNAGNTIEHCSLQKWEPPPSGTLMMNSDINVLQNGRFGLGVIFRDEKGVVVFACKTELRMAASTTLMEDIAIRYGCLCL